MQEKMTDAAGRLVDSLSRRRFLAWLGGGGAALAAALGLDRLGTPGARAQIRGGRVTANIKDQTGKTCHGIPVVLADPCICHPHVERGIASFCTSASKTTRTTDANGNATFTNVVPKNGYVLCVCGGYKCHQVGDCGKGGRCATECNGEQRTISVAAGAHVTENFVLTDCKCP